MKGIPKLLYRGDSDYYGIRDLKSTLHHYQLQTNLIKGGTGHDIFRFPLMELVGRHVNPGWAKTHFLSFSEDRRTAMRYASRCEEAEMDAVFNACEEYFNDDQDWDFVIICINTEKVDWRKLDQGVYLGEYFPSLRKFQVYPGTFRVILIDVSTAIQQYKNYPNYTSLYRTALKDKEWLLLPATQMDQNTSEFSAILDGKCIEELTFYRRLK